MQKPKMILFDYGQTLMSESGFDALAGDHAVLAAASSNPLQVTAPMIVEAADRIQTEIHRQEMDRGLEVHDHIFQNFLYESLGLEFDRSQDELSELFWDAAAPGEPTPHIYELLDFLQQEQIRYGVISNISFSGKVLRSRLDRFFANRPFEFVMASSEYIFRKPSPLLFELALKKANLPAGEVWYCGDNPVCDIDGPAALGISPVWYRGALLAEREPPKSEHLAISDWLELLELLKSLERR